jgi:hypothetical protein
MGDELNKVTSMWMLYPRCASLRMVFSVRQYLFNGLVVSVRQGCRKFVSIGRPLHSSDPTRKSPQIANVVLPSLGAF